MAQRFPSGGANSGPPAGPMQAQQRYSGPAQPPGSPMQQRPYSGPNFPEAEWSGTMLRLCREGYGAGPGAGAGKRKRRLADKILPQKVRDLVPESQAYMDLLAFERKLDATIHRKRLDIQEALKRPMKQKRKLRIFISNTFYPGQGDNAVASWELRVEGRLLDDSKNDPNKVKRKFSSFFKSLVIELDKELYGPDNHLVEWHRTLTTQETDGFQVKRPGYKNVRCTILLLLDYQPLQFKLDQRLARLLGVHTQARPVIVNALWQYVKTHRLQDPHEREYIACDKYLEQIFGCARVKLAEVPARLGALLHAPDPIVINHVIAVEPPHDAKQTACYDIDVEASPRSPYLASANYNSGERRPVLNAYSSRDGRIVCTSPNNIRYHAGMNYNLMMFVSAVLAVLGARGGCVARWRGPQSARARPSATWCTSGSPHLSLSQEFPKKDNYFDCGIFRVVAYLDRVDSRDSKGGFYGDSEVEEDRLCAVCPRGADVRPRGSRAVWREAAAEAACSALLVLLTCLPACAQAPPLQRALAAGLVVTALVQVSPALLPPTQIVRCLTA
ncbi:SWI/SNF-related matrix-associated actin-dependent regulator of chromatin subfamily D member 1 [Papilio xuthus]|uniref:SWI/SNF-related matrix-associated actin-dependent regulator of chromatin subfamily D member 1 n=1 Tax=Papilio xuthus TaxID=66420 RepID=A0A194QJ37_PAPXU|nr:SWI/SNF-related matrix-associated actin-dependent regulator of chromatin subfamily D member 1 [Papilio xuthus]